MKILRRRVRVLRFEASQQIIQQTLANFRRLETDEECVAQALAEAERVEQERRKRLLSAVRLLQMSFRMRRFRRSLHTLKLNLSVLKCQRAWRMKLFRRSVAKLKQEKTDAERKVLAVTKCQRWLRMKIFRKRLAHLKVEAERFNKTVIWCQRVIRLKLFRRALSKLIIERDHLLKCVLVCQKSFRMKMFRSRLSILRQEAIKEKRNQSAILIQKRWRLFKFRKAMDKYRDAATKIQRWIREKKERLDFIRLKRVSIVVQLRYKAKFEMKCKAAITLQTHWRMTIARRKFVKATHSIILIQRWIRSLKERFLYLRLRRSLPFIQMKARELLKRREAAAIKIQRAFRMYRFRAAMKMYKGAVLVIQNWTRSMKTRYEFLQKKRIICEVQIYYRKVFMVRRTKAAVKIQSFWRGVRARRALKERRAELDEQIRMKEETERLYKYATIIQAAWRGHSVRKQTDSILNSIRNRLSVIYIHNSSSHPEQTKTLGHFFYFAFLY